MSHYCKVFFGWFLSAVVSVTLVLSQFPVVSYAEDVSNDRKAVAHEGTWGDYGINYILHHKYWTITDTTGITPSTVGLPDFYYTQDHVTFFKLSGPAAVSMVLNKGLGIVLKPDNLSTFLTPFWTLMNLKEIDNNLYAQGAVYDNSNNFLGYALNDITGCYYQEPASGTDPEVNVPSDFTNDVYYYYKKYNNDNVTIPYFTFNAPPSSFIRDNFKPTFGNFNLSTVMSNYNSLLSSHNYVFNSRFWYGNEHLSFYATGIEYDNCHYADLTDVTFIADQSSHFDSLVRALNINSNNQTLDYTYLWSHANDSFNKNFSYKYYQNNSFITIPISYYNLNSTNPTVYTTTRSSEAFGQASSSGNPIFSFPCHSATFYRSVNDYNSVQNKTYSPNSFVSTTYNNYNTNNDNSFKFSYSDTSTSISDNDNIYDDCFDTYYEFIDNDYVDVDQITENTTTIINNYYPIVDDDPLGPDNPPDNPDNPSGGGDDDPDIDNEGILDAILDALARFFRAIGKILATILAGLLEVVDTVLEAIAGLMENFTGITDFLGALFSWLPSPIPEVIGAGVSICILFAIFRFIRG